MAKQNTSEALVIGAGFAGIAAATQLAELGHQVDLLERHDHAGGRARVFEAEGFTFDMGPSWYWMPDVFESYFKKFGSDVQKELNLIRLDPSYTVWFEDGPVNISADLETLKATFDSMEAGAGARLQSFLDEAEIKYEIGMNNFVRKPAHNVMEFATWETLQQSTKLTLLKSFSAHARSFFTDKRLLQIIEFPVLFLGAKPEKTPALYSLMNYADTVLGTWYPMGGMHEIVRAMVRVAEKKGVRFHYNADVKCITDDGSKTTGAELQDGTRWNASTVVAGADYHHVEQHLLPAQWRRYDAQYWDSRVMSPSSLLFYVGVNTRVPKLQHHNLFFDTPFGPHAETIYDTQTWPDDPLFYISAPTKTDNGIAPEGCENMFFLIPWRPVSTINPDCVTATSMKCATDSLRTSAWTFVRTSFTRGHLHTKNFRKITVRSKATRMASPTPCDRRLFGNQK